MSERTCIMMVSSEAGWIVYRVRTASSEYHLGVFSGGWGKRACAVLRGRSRGGMGEAIDVQDSAPLVGGESLFSVSTDSWVGRALEIGTVTTSPIQSVEEERDRSVVTAITTRTSLARTDAATAASPRTSVRAARREEKESSTWAPYPEDHVEYVELASRLLRAAYQKRGLLTDLAAHPQLCERFELALSECFLMLKGIGGKMASEGSASKAQR